MPKPNQEQLELAAQNYRRLLKKNPEDAHGLYILGLLEAQLGDVDRALVLIEKSLALRPDVPEILCNYGLMLLDKKNYEKALGAFSEGHKV